MPNPDIEKQLICLACVRRHMSKESIERECRIHEAARWFVECKERLIKYEKSSEVGYQIYVDNLLEAKNKAYADLKAAVEGE